MCSASRLRQADPTWRVVLFGSPPRCALLTSPSGGGCSTWSREMFGLFPLESVSTARAGPSAWVASTYTPSTGRHRAARYPDVPRAPWSPDETDRADGGVQLFPAAAGA